ncbi:MAG: hypothetical protein HGA65_08765 [Oscillochloris sp.]|nr:hypothetical protein [Oscillochloris sp.]
MATQDTPTPSTPTEPAAASPTTRRICCLTAPQRRTPSMADYMRAAAVWAQIFQESAAARGQAAEGDTTTE